MRCFLVCLLLSVCAVPELRAQQGHYELGMQLDLNPMTEVGGGGGIGPRFDYKFNEHLAFDAQLTYRRNTVLTSNDIGQTQLLAGLRAGQRVGDIGFFVRARAGFVHFGSIDGLSVVSRTTVPIFDLGGTLEHYHGPLILRFELGELFTAYGSAIVPPPPPPVIVFPPGPPKPLGTRANPVLGFGVAFRF